MRDCVVLLHGLAETPLIMAALAIVLRRAGYDVDNIAYPSTSQDIGTLVEQHVKPVFESHKDKRRLHFVTHSLGGVMLHAGLSNHLPSNLGRVVMTAPGLKGSDALELYRRNWVFRMTFGPAAYQSGTGQDAFARVLEQRAGYELGVIAGCVSMDPIANLIVPWPHDGKISVARTRIDGMADHIVLMTPHDLTPSDPIAIAQTLHFLAHGHFLHLFTPSAGVHRADAA
jgi:hypothetical protein